MSAAVSSLPLFSANNPLAVTPAPAPSPEASHPNAFAQMLKQRQAQAPAPMPAAAAPAPVRAPATPAAKAPQAQAPARPAPTAPPAQAARSAEAKAAGAGREPAPADAAEASDTTGTASREESASADTSVGSLLAGLNLPMAATPSAQAGGQLGRGQLQASEGEADTVLSSDTGGAPGRGARRLFNGADGSGPRAERQGAASGTDTPAARLLAEAAEAAPSFREVAAHVHGAAEAARSDAPAATGALLAAGLAAAAPPAPAEAPAVVHLPTPVDAPDFAQSLGVQVSVLAADGIQQAELHLNPPEMGPVSVQIAIDGTQAQVDFGADMASTRQVIEAGLPELASALRDAGFTLTGGGVSQQARQGSHDGGGSPREGGRGRLGSVGSVEAAGEAAPRRTVTRVSAGGVDLYA